MSLSKVILTTGGTGGHIFPALAVADALRMLNPGIELLFMGGSGPEGDLARKHNIAFQALPARGIMGRGMKGIFGGLGWLATGLPKALVAVRRFKPDAVISFGGYAGFCPAMAAALMGIPTAIHEQNSVPGVTNKVLAQVARRIFLSFPDSLNVFPAKKTTLTGNPVRKEIVDVSAKRHGKTHAKTLLVVGGSQGARPINDAVIKALPEWNKAGITLIHQTGKSDFQRVRASYETAKADLTQVHDFIEDMAETYAKVDLALCRSGASTVFEIAAAGVPAIFVPFPQATHDHQTMNAKAMSDIGAARLLLQKEMTEATLGAMVLDLIQDTDRLNDMEKAAQRFAKANAAADIAMGLEALAA